MQIKSYDEAVKYLEGFIGKVRFEITPEFLKHHDPLERMRVLLDLLGNPQEKFKSVLVGGTSGKGSTAYLISHILTTAGYKTGITISPHLQKINERLQINGKSISDGEFTNLLASILSSIESMKKMNVGAPSYFEILIAMAFLYFAKAKVDIAVVEVGMGGEFDATNTLYPLVAVLTNVSLDHTNVLGGTVQKIARTKVGIIKGFYRCHPEFISGSPAHRQVSLQPKEMLNQASSDQHDKKKKPIVIAGVKQPSVIKIVEERCKELGAKLYRLGKDLPAGRQGFDFEIKKESLEGSLFDVTSAHGRGKKLHALQNLQLALLGRYQVENASLAIETVLQLKNFSFKVSEENIRQALKTAFFPGRFENIQFQISNFKFQIVLDGAHNPTKMREFLKSLKKLYPKAKKIFVVGFKFDKDVKKMLKQITKAADAIIVTQFYVKTDMSSNASAEALNIKSLLRSRIPLRGKISNLKYRRVVKIITLKNSKMALDKALSLSAIQQFNNSTIIVVTGSLYLVGEVRSFLL